MNFLRYWKNIDEAVRGHVISGLFAVGAGASSLGVTVAGVDAMFRMLIDVGSFIMIVISLVGSIRAWRKTK